MPVNYESLPRLLVIFVAKPRLVFSSPGTVSTFRCISEVGLLFIHFSQFTVTNHPSVLLLNNFNRFLLSHKLMVARHISLQKLVAAVKESA